MSKKNNENEIHFNLALDQIAKNTATTNELLKEFNDQIIDIQKKYHGIGNGLNTINDKINSLDKLDEMNKNLNKIMMDIHSFTLYAKVMFALTGTALFLYCVNSIIALIRLQGYVV